LLGAGDQIAHLALLCDAVLQFLLNVSGLNFENTVILAGAEGFTNTLSDCAEGSVVLNKHNVPDVFRVEVVTTDNVLLVNLQVERSHNSASAGGSEEQTFENDGILLGECAAKVGDVCIFEDILVDECFLNLCTLLLGRL
jgi:hypothetical protein